MFSQCPHCRAIFNVAEPDIQAHHGLVRCGHCKAIFHAVINEVEDTRPLSHEADDTSTLEIPLDDAPLDDAPAPSHAPDPDQEGSPGPTPYLEPLPEPTPHRVTPVSADPESDELTEPEPAPDELPEPVGGAGTIPNDDWYRIDIESAAEPDEINREDEDTDWVEPALPGAREAEESKAPEPELPGDIVEEITIEAPPTLVGDFEAELKAAERAASRPVGDAGEMETDDAPAADRVSAGETSGTPKRRAPVPAEAAAQAAGTPLKSPYRARDVRMVELPQPQPFKTASLSLLSVFLVLLLVWQVKTFYLDELAQVPLLRPYLETLCRPLGCVLPPRRDFARIELAGTSISINPEVPGALAITAGLLNNARFPQPYPPLRVTLTDREGKVVGRRTYSPQEYRSGPTPGLLPVGEVRDVTINLAQPDRDVVGYEVELVTPTGADGA